MWSLIKTEVIYVKWVTCRSERSSAILVWDATNLRRNENKDCYVDGRVAQDEEMNW